MSIIGKIFSSGAGDLVKNVGGVIDNLTTSKEEKLEAERKVKELIANYDAGALKFEVKSSWVDLLQLVLITVIGAYFGGRSFEKVKK
jgi:hypothetical protein